MDATPAMNAPQNELVLRAPWDLLLPLASLRCTPCTIHRQQLDEDIFLAGGRAPQIGTDTLVALTCVLTSCTFQSASTDTPLQSGRRAWQ